METERERKSEEVNYEKLARKNDRKKKEKRMKVFKNQARTEKW